MTKIASVIGARPQFIKYSPLARAIENQKQSSKNKIENIVIHSGQHYDYKMSEIFFNELGITEPAYHLNVGSASHAVQTGLILRGSEDVFIKEKPGMVLVFGDINTALGAALAAAKLHIPVVHVEAGLRSYNRRMPEEINRVLIDHMALLLLCPSDTAVRNLQKEGFNDTLDQGRLINEIDSSRVTRLNPSRYESLVINVGDLMYDALLFSIELAEKKSAILEKLQLQNRDYYLLTMHRSENTEEISRIMEINDFLNRVTRGKKVIFPIHPRTEKVYREAKIKLADHIQTIEPVGYFDMLKLLKNSAMLFTDSGGMQKEAFWLKVPCVTLRDETEWVETVENGWNVLYKNYKGRHDFKTQAEFPYGDGCTAARVLEIIKSFDMPGPTPQTP